MYSIKEWCLLTIWQTEPLFEVADCIAALRIHRRWKTINASTSSSAEVEALYARPHFNAVEQRLYFTLSKQEHTALARHTHIRTRVYFILQLGYFKAKQQVFNFSFDDVTDDTRFILNTYYGETESVQLSGHISRDYARKQKQAIQALYGYRSWSSDYAPDTAG